MTTDTQTNPHPNIAPPAGAAVVDDWEPGPPPYRVILGRTRTVGPAELQLAVIQLADGSFDGCCLSDDLTERREARIEPPLVHLRAGDPLTVTEALERDYKRLLSAGLPASLLMTEAVRLFGERAHCID